MVCLIAVLSKPNFVRHYTNKHKLSRGDMLHCPKCKTCWPRPTGVATDNHVCHHLKAATHEAGAEKMWAIASGRAAFPRPCVSMPGNGDAQGPTQPSATAALAAKGDAGKAGHHVPAGYDRGPGVELGTASEDAAAASDDAGAASEDAMASSTNNQVGAMESSIIIVDDDDDLGRGMVHPASRPLPSLRRADSRPPRTYLLSATATRRLKIFPPQALLQLRPLPL
jgi:hypothetical protein